MQASQIFRLFTMSYRGMSGKRAGALYGNFTCDAILIQICILVQQAN